MRPLRLLLRVGSMAVAALLAPPLFGQSSNFDLSYLVNAPPTVWGISLLPAANGFTYAVGFTNSPATFPTSSGALRVQSTGATLFIQKLAPDGTVAASALVAEAFGYNGSDAAAAAADASGNVYVALTPNAIAGVPDWNGGLRTYILKVCSQFDQVLYAITSVQISCSLAFCALKTMDITQL
jgi:hypothetical protein